MARPRKQIDQAIVERLANRQASSPMIAAVVGCSTRTLKRRFGRHLPLWREAGKTLIINAQWEAMERGNLIAAIFLGKQYLGQAEKHEIDATLAVVPDDPMAAYQGDADLLQRSLQLERDFADATALALNAGSPGLSRLAVPPPPPRAGGNSNGHADPGDVQ